MRGVDCERLKVRDELRRGQQQTAKKLETHMCAVALAGPI